MGCGHGKLERIVVDGRNSQKVQIDEVLRLIDKTGKDGTRQVKVAIMEAAKAASLETAAAFVKATAHRNACQQAAIEELQRRVSLQCPALIADRPRH